MSDPQFHAKKLGISLLLISAVLFSTAGLFVKGVSAGSWDVVFWRGLFAVLLTTIFIKARGTMRQDFREMGGPGWLVAVLGAVGTAAFIPAFKFTSIANVSLIYAASPLLCGLFAWLWFREMLTRTALLGCMLAIVGVAIIVSGSLNGINLKGDLLALWMTIAMSLVMVVYRRYPNTPSAGPAVMSSVLLLPLALYFGEPFQNTAIEISIMAAFGLVFAFAAVLLAEGAKRIPSGEAALLSTLEAPFAPLLAWLVISEVPPVATFVGGAVILAGVFYSQWPSLQSRADAPSI